MASHRAILHVDMDAFYASVEQRDRPELRGKPVIVGGSGSRGVVAAASYEVRRYGVHSAMPTREALRRCPDAICVPPRIAHYAAVSREIFAVFHEFTPLVQGLSLDEAFLDVTASLGALGSAEHIGREIKRRIRERTGLTASVGVAPNKLVAKIASDLRKPDGLVVVRTEDIRDLLDPLPIRKLFGLGPKTAPKVEALGIRTLGDLRLAPPSRLRPVFGRYTERVQQRAAGIDDRAVVPDADEKQVSAEETFDVDIADRGRLHAEIQRLADKACSRLRARKLAGGCVTVKIR
ncbi:MAG TPA: DNA polymerase IV, partial [Steroidobacteraceae bacterium]